jgi:hypothetical protein
MNTKSAAIKQSDKQKPLQLFKQLANTLDFKVFCSLSLFLYACSNDDETKKKTENNTLTWSSI